MRAIKKFDDFVKEGIVKKQSPNKSRAEFLVNESENSYAFLLKKIKAFGANEETANDLIKSLFGIKGMFKKDPEKAKKVADDIIKNTYRTLMTRGQKGCYVYCCDENLAEYLKKKD